MNHQDLSKLLIGEWRGTGHGEYPTIEPFEYTEILRFSSDYRPFIHYEQKTMRRNIGTEEYISSHWENGFIRLLEDGRVQINNTQSGGRVEVLTGSLEQANNGFIMHLESTSFLNDPRMMETSRMIEVDGDELRYSMHMRTNAVPEIAIHVEASLKRKQD